jgi:hypothetical protein
MGNMQQIGCTSPIDIVKNKQTDKICKLKCSYQFNYAPTSLSIWNADLTLFMEPEEVAIPPVIYNDENYNVEAVLLMAPSAHTFNGNKADAELIIVHMNVTFTKKLMVCIPIKVSSTSTTDATTYLDLIMNEVVQTAPSAGKRTTYTNPTFTLNKFVPMTPYFSYTGANLLWNPLFGGKCYGKKIDPDQFGRGSRIEPVAADVDYIVFHIDDAISMSPQALRGLRQVIPHPTNIVSINASQNPGGLHYNPNGPIPKSKGEIYIDCQPTGDDGEILVAARVDSSGLLDNEMLKKVLNFTFLKIIVGALAMLLIWKFAIKAINGIAANSARTAGGAKTVGGKLLKTVT